MREAASIRALRDRIARVFCLGRPFVATMEPQRPVGSLISMNTPLRIVVLSTLVLALAACSGGGSGSGGGQPEGAPAEGGGGEDRGAVTQGDVDALGATLGEAWGVDCGESVVDMAGYPKITCPIPDDMMTPGMASNAVSIQTFTEWEQADSFKESYVLDGEGFEVHDGWFVTAPTPEIAQAAAAELE